MTSAPPVCDPPAPPVCANELRQRGLDCHRAGQLAAAQSAYRAALDIAPDDARALYLLGMTYAQQRAFPDAIAFMQRSLALYDAMPSDDSACFDALHHLGSAYLESGQPALALPLLHRALDLQPHHANAHYTLGNALNVCGQGEQAILHLREAVRLQPRFAHAINNLGSVLSAQGQHEEAVLVLRRAALLAPDEAQIQGNLSACLFALGRLDEAVQSARRALAQQPHSEARHVALAKILWAQGQTDEARRLLQNAPVSTDDASALAVLGDAYMAFCDFDAARDLYENALRIAPADACLHDALGAVLLTQGALEAAEACFRHALALHPDFTLAHLHLSGALWGLNRLDEAETSIRRALALAPDDAHARHLLGILRLKQGHWHDAWTDYDHIRHLDLGTPRRFPQPRWNGEPLHGKTLLLHCQFGIGDTLQFLRYLPLVRAAGGRVVLECQRELASLLRSNLLISPAPDTSASDTSASDDLVLPAGLLPIDNSHDAPAASITVCPNMTCDELVVRASSADARLPRTHFDVQFNIMSLPALFASTPDSLPDTTPYLTADEPRRRKWRAKLEPIPGFKVGIVWSASTEGIRSCQVSDFAPLAALPDVSLISLQKGPGARRLAARPADMQLWDFDADIQDFADTAALITQLDLIISVDTAVAHLAGALHAPIWTLLAHGPCWRWLLDRADSPWYPSMRLFRQPRPGDWRSVFQDAADALRQHLASIPIDAQANV